MTIFEKFFFELPEVKGQFLPLPYENPNIGQCLPKIF